MITKICEVKAVYSTKIKAKDRPQITRSHASIEILRPFYFEVMEQKELLSALLLDRSNKVLGWIKISEGNAFSSVFDIQYLCRCAILTNAQSVILCHNHPSGSLKPSESDFLGTKKAKDALKLLDITLLDHVIITEDSYYSFADHGEI